MGSLRIKMAVGFGLGIHVSRKASVKLKDATIGRARLLLLCSHLSSVTKLMILGLELRE